LIGLGEFYRTNENVRKGSLFSMFSKNRIVWRPEGVFSDSGLLDLVVWIYFLSYAE
jgi:hypothetical protein